MKFHFNLFITLFLVSSCLNLNGSTATYLNKKNNCIEVIKASSKKELEHIIKLIKNNKKKFEKDWPDIEYLECCDGYIVDLNNDGKKEYVFTCFSGSVGYFLYIFAIDNNNIEMLKVPSKLRSLGYSFYNPFTDECELFVRTQNKIYLCGYEPYGLKRNIYLWENNKCKLVCDKFWIKQQQKLFTELYKSGRYNDAFNLLYSFENKIRKQIDPKTDLWLRNDIALSAIKNGYPQTALEIIKAIKSDVNFQNTTNFFLKAIENNEKLCIAAIAEDIKHGTKGKYNYDWLLEYKDNSIQVCLDKRIDSLLSAVVPDINSKNIDLEDLKMRLWVNENCVKLIDNRYITFSGFFPHNATAKAFFWCDIKEKTSAIASCVASYLNDEILYITSRSLFVHELPKEFYLELNNWLKLVNIIPSEQLFYDRNGKIFVANVSCSH